LSDDDEADNADRKRAIFWLAVLLAGAGLSGFLWLWLGWRDGAGIALLLATYIVGFRTSGDGDVAERRLAARLRGAHRVMLAGFALVMAWVIFRLLQRSI
jgi:hypothetical protein